MTAIAKLSSALFGTSTLLNGLACTPTSPASMTVQVAAGEVYALASMDATDYGSVVADTTHQILKQGIVLDTQTFSTPAPATSGHAINYLIQVGYADQDTDSAVLPYYNASNPSVAWSGPSNTGVAQYTTRKGACVVSIKTGVSALAGTQVTPTPDVGYVGAWVITVLQGATTVTSGNISQYPSAPFLTETLLNKISQTTADTRYAQIGSTQNSSYVYADAAGSTTAYTATYSPAITSLADSHTLALDTSAIGTNTTTTPTFSPNGLTARTIVKNGGAALAIGDMPTRAILSYDAANTRWILLNPALQGMLLTTVTITSTGANNYTPTTGAKMFKVTLVGGGAAGGGTPATTGTQSSAGGGGGAGAARVAWLTKSQLDAIGYPIVVTIGAGGTGVVGANGNAGGTSSFGSLMTCNGGTASNVGTAITPPLISSSHGTNGTSSGQGIAQGGIQPTAGKCFGTSSVLTGAGGGCYLGTGGQEFNNAAAGSAGTGYGAGGGGSGVYASGIALAGGAGANGVCIIEEYA